MDPSGELSTSTRSRVGTSQRTTATAVKRDSLMAELERDPQHSAAKRQQRTQAFSSQLAHASLERQLVALTTAKNDLEKKLREKDAQVERLEKDRRWLAEREQEEREEKERERVEWEEAKRKSDHDLRSVRAALTALQESHANLQDERDDLARKTSKTISSQKAQLATLTHQNAHLSAQLAEAQALASDRQRTVLELRDELEGANDRARHGGGDADGDTENWGVVRAELHRQAAYLRQLEGTNAKMTMELNALRERHASIEVLREEKRGLEGKLVVMEELRQKVVQLEAELDAGRREREEWASRSGSASNVNRDDRDMATPSKTPVGLTQTLSALRLTHARLLEDHGAARALLAQREVQITQLEQQAGEHAHELTVQHAAVKGLREKLERVERKAELEEREVGFLQALVASFTAESQAHIDADASTSNSTLLLDSVGAQRVEQLETLLSEYKVTIDELRKELDDMGAGGLGGGRTWKELAQEAGREKTARAEMEQALTEAEEAAEKYLAQIDTLEQTLFELRGDIGAGTHIPPGTRVLSLKNNPAQEWNDLRQEVMDRLKGENEALLRRLREVEESGMRATASASASGIPDADLVPRESLEVATREKSELEEVVKQKEKRLLRLQQVFTAKSAEFREAIASILGLKLAFYPNGQVRVTSVYDLSASFVFQPAPKATQEGARMQLIAQGEGGPQDLPQLMRYWVEDEQCIPGFLASVTLECWEKEKRDAQKGD